MDTKWVKDSFDKGKLEILKLARSSRIKLEITSLKKKKDERIKLIGNKVLELIEEGKLDSEQFEPDFTYIKNIDSDILEKTEDLKAQNIPDEEEESAERVDIVTIESQKVLTADSIPMESEEDEENKPRTEGENHAEK